MHTNRITFLSFFFLFVLIFSAKSQITASADLDKSKLISVFSEKNTDIETAFFTDSLINFAQKYLKTPYRRGGNGTSRFDCSGFTSYVYKNFGYPLLRTAAGQALKNGITIPKDSLQKGDLVFFKGRNAKQNRVGHVGIIYEVFPDGTFSFIHASCKLGVTITNGTKEYYRTRYVTAKRIFEAPYATEENVLAPSQKDS